VATYHFSIQDDFPNQKVDPSVLTAEIEGSTITATLTGITISEDDVAIDFDTELTGDEQTTLATIVGNHTGEPFHEGPQRVNVIAEQTNTTTTWENAAVLDSEPVPAGDYIIAFYYELKIQDTSDTSACQVAVTFNGSEVSTGISGVTQWDSRSGSAIVALTAGDGPTLAVQWHRIGTANTAVIRRIRMSLTPLHEEAEEE